jgi:hypothetical protein
MERQHFSFGVRQVVINSVFSILPIFMLSFFEIPRCVFFLKKVDYYRSIFFGKITITKRNIDSLHSPLLCLHKEQGGLGIMNLDL